MMTCSLTVHASIECILTSASQRGKKKQKDETRLLYFRNEIFLLEIREDAQILVIACLEVPAAILIALDRFQTWLVFFF